MRMRSIAAAISGAVLIATAGTAYADTIYNDLDPTIDVDTVGEVMNLTYNTFAGTGESGTTQIRLREDDKPDHPNCNIQGGPHQLTVRATSSDPAVADLANGPTYTFGSCDDVIDVTVVATGLGSATINFTVDSSNTANDPKLMWNTAEADFVVNVTEGGSGGTVCDADPAAPAWAAAILKASGLKPGAKETTNLISTIAREMTQHADFAGLQKSNHPAYEDAVRDRLDALTTKPIIADAASAARPGWTCVVVD